MNEGLFCALLALTLVTLLVVAWTAMALGRLRAGDPQAGLDAQLQRKELQDLRVLLQTGNERMERELRREIAESSQGARQELSQNLATFQQSLTQQGRRAGRLGSSFEETAAAMAVEHILPDLLPRLEADSRAGKLLKVSSIPVTKSTAASSI